MSESYSCVAGGKVAGGKFATLLSATFSDGVASVVSFASSFQAINGTEQSVAISSGSLPAGVTLDPIGKRLIYDGAPGVTSVNVTLTGTANAPKLSFSNAAGQIPVMAGIVFPKGVVTGPLGATDAGLRVVVRRTWNDGSAKHAVVCGVCDASAVVTFNTAPISGTALTSANIQTAAPTAVVDLGALGSVSLASLLATPFETWISTEKMVECHYRAQVGASQAYVEFQVRLFSDGKMWVRAVVENSPRLLASAVSYALTGSVTISGSVVTTYSATNLYPNTLHVHERWIGATQYDVIVGHDRQQINRSKLVPNFGMASSITEPALAALTTAYSIGGRGMYTQSMGDTGFQSQIGLIPQWDASYLVSGDARAYRSVMAHAKLGFNYPILWREAGRNLTPADYPTANRNGVGGSGDTQYSAGALTWEVAHHPSMGYLAYLLTGDALYADAMMGQAATFFQVASTSKGSGTSRIIKNLQTRETAWFQRTLGQCAAIIPDGMPELVALQAWLTNNINYFKGISVDVVGANAGLGYPDVIGTYSETLPHTIPPWMFHFWIGAIGHVSDLEPLTGAAKTSLESLRNWMYRGIVGILGVNPGHPFDHAGSYNLTISNEVVPNFSVRTASQIYQTWDEVRAASWPGVTDSNTLTGTSGGDPAGASGGYWGNLLPAISYAVDHGAPGASAAYGRMTGASNWNSVVGSGFNAVPHWGVTPRASLSSVTKGVGIFVTTPGSGMPAWRSALSPLTWNEVGTNTLSVLNPENDPLINPSYPGSAPWRAVTGHSSIISAWSGGIWDEANKKLWVYGGGHQDYAGNEVYNWDATSATFNRLTKPSGAIGNTGLLNDGLDSTGVYFDGKQRSVHTYNNFALRNGTWWCFGGSTYITGFGPNVAFRWDGTDLVRESTGTVSAGYGGICYDSFRDVFWMIDGGTNNPRKYNPITKTSTTVGAWVNLAGTYVKPHYDAVRDTIVLFGSSIHVFSGNGLSDSVAITTTGTPPGYSLAAGGSAYDPVGDRYLVWNGGTSVYVLTPPAVGQNPKTATWVWSKIDAVSGSPTSPAAAGTYGRFWYSPSLNCCGVVNATSQKMYVFPLD